MKVVDENTTVEIGKYYLVKCAKVRSKMDDSIEYWPVLGDAHKDVQIGVDYKHYHNDGRFASNKYCEVDEYGLTNNIINCEGGAQAYEFIGIEFRRRKCLRLTTGIKPPPPDVGGKKYWTWYTQQVGKSCKGKRCPHLGTIMHEREGKWVCPLHNLTGDPKTEKVIQIGFAKPETEIVKTFKDMLGL